MYKRVGGILSNSLFKSVVMVTVFSVATRFLGFLFKIYMGRELGAELLGIYQIAFSVFMVFNVIVSSGLPLSVSKWTARQQVLGNKKSQHAVVTAALIVGLVVSVGICVLTVLLQVPFSTLFTDNRCIGILLTLLPAVVASAVYSAFRGALWGKKDYFSVGFSELFEQIIRIAAFFVLINLVFDYADKSIIAGWSLSIACVFSSILVAILYFKSGQKVASPKGHFKPVLKSSIPITGVRTATSLIQPLIAVLFPAMLVLSGVQNELALSIYGVIMGMTFPLLFLPSTIVGSLSFALIPELSTAIAAKNFDIVKSRIKSSLCFSVVISAIFIPFYMAFGKEIGIFLYDNQFSGIYLVKAAWIMIPLGLSNVTSSILNAFNMETKSFVNNILGGLILVGFVVFLSGTMRVDALVWGFGLCLSLTTFLNIIMIKKRTKFSLGLKKTLWLCLLFIVPSVLLSKWCVNLIGVNLPLVLTLAIGGTLSIGIFILLCVCFNLIDFVLLLPKISFLKIFKNKKQKL